MPKTWIAEDAISELSANMMQQFGNWTNYCVVSGCDITYSFSDMTVTVAAGTVKHNGVVTSTAGGAVTLVADATNPRWALIGISSSGVVTLVSGTPAADPVEPSLGDLVEVCFVKVEANQTTSANCAHRHDRRMFGPKVASTSAQSTSTGAVLALSADVATSTSMSEIPGLSVTLPHTNTAQQFRGLIAYTAAATSDYYFSVACTVQGTGSGGPTPPPSANPTTYIKYRAFDLSATGSVRAATTSSWSGGNANGFGVATPGVISFEGMTLIPAPSSSLIYTLKMFHKSDANGFTKAKTRLELF